MIGVEAVADTELKTLFWRRFPQQFGSVAGYRPQDRSKKGAIKLFLHMKLALQHRPASLGDVVRRRLPTVELLEQARQEELELEHPLPPALYDDFQYRAGDRLLVRDAAQGDIRVIPPTERGANRREERMQSLSGEDPAEARVEVLKGNGGPRREPARTPGSWRARRIAG